MLEDQSRMQSFHYVEELANSFEIQNQKKVLIDWLFEIGEQFYQSNLTIHIAIAYLEKCYMLGFHLSAAD